MRISDKVLAKFSFSGTGVGIFVGYESREESRDVNATCPCWLLMFLTGGQPVKTTRWPLGDDR